MADVAIFLGAGEARVAGRSFAISPGDAGAVRLKGGPALRPLCFGERAALTRAALAAAAPAEELSQAVLAVASTGEAKHPAAAAIALHLAGAGITEVGFAAAQSLLARQLGWSAGDVAQAPAAEVDALAADWQTSLKTGPSGWTRFVLAGPAAGEGDDPQAVALFLAEDLLRRASAGIDPDALPALMAIASVAGQGDASKTGSPRRARSVENPVPSTGGSAAEAMGEVRLAPSPPLQEAPIDVPGSGPSPQPQGQAAERSGLASAPDGASTTTAPAASASAATADSRSHVSANPTLRPFPVPLSANPTWSLSPIPANPTPHPSPVAAAIGATQGGARPASPSALQDLWVRRPSLTASRTQTARPADAAAPRAFAGWFDDAPSRTGRTRPDLTDPAPWVWARTDPPDAPAPDLPEAQPLTAREDPTDALAEALHLAADLRGIAP